MWSPLRLMSGLTACEGRRRRSGPPLREVPDAAGTDSDPEPIAGTAAAEAEDEAEDEAATGSEAISANQRE